MYEISFRGVGVTRKEEGRAIIDRDGILDGRSMVYLKQICAERVLLLENHIFVTEVSAFCGRLSKCLKYVDMTGNNLQGTIPALYRLLSSPNLETIIFISKLYENMMTSLDRKKRVMLTPLESKIPSQIHRAKSLKRRQNKQSHERSCQSRELPFLNDEHQTDGILKLYVSRNLKTVIFHFDYGSLSMSRKRRLMNAHSLETFVLRYGHKGLKDFTGEVFGVEHIKNLDFSYNDLSNVTLRAFEHFTGIETLIFSHTNINALFMSRESNRLFRVTTCLKSLDLSSNSLSELSTGTFRDNHRLESVYLRDNHFQTIPFDISLTPQLRLLDLSKNAVVQLSRKQRQQLDAHARLVADFHLVLNENILSCGCEAVPFLLWLSQTAVSLDNNGNYSCVTAQGQVSYTFAYRDTQALWRICYGKFYLWFSLVLLALMVTCFLAVVFISRHSNYFRAAIFRIFNPTFRMKTRVDYPIAVSIGYAERDYRFPFHHLLPFLERDLNLTTYVRDRDSLPGQYVASAIMDAMQSSWRIVLVVTAAFLRDDQWAEFTFRSAVYSQSLSNPAQVVLIVEERLRNRLPAHLLAAVTDDNIVRLDQLRMCYELKQRLRALLLHG
ncbi:toll-like receptor 4 [Aplysia californica]|uniref:Toll-like receptor 4 n=1 Tax=Aplysia californica TaxID=6500 RepID=A0ABM1A0E2_APLCA|nr:toll-like receptor 4 [Aplysia californica]